MSESHGLSDKTVGSVRRTLARHTAVERAILFGSRAKGNFKPGSDIDLALVGAQLDQQTMSRIAGEIDDLPIPYGLSLILLNETIDSAVRAHIERVGVSFYEKVPTSRPA
jgi:predicted nucleotidyltransferase